MTVPTMNEIPNTPATLLGRLRDVNNQDAWEEFVDAYGPKVYEWCRRFNLQESDAADVTQNVLTRLVSAMQTFRYDTTQGSFRGWLKTVTNNAARDFLPISRRPGRGSGDSDIVYGLDALRDPRAIEDLSRLLEEEAERELLMEAEARVRLRVKPSNWQAWELTAREGLTAPEAAEHLEIRVSDVYVARSRVTEMLRKEVEKLDNDPLGEL